MANFSKLKVTELRAELKSRGLPTDGLKNVLVARLEAAETEDGSDSENTVQGDPTKIDTASAASPDTVSPVLPSPSAGAESLPDAPLPESAEAADFEAVEQNTTTIEHSADQTPVPTAQNETSIDLQQPIESNDKHQSALPSVEPQEAMDDRQKRKRRSKSPSLSAADTARKRFRTDTDTEADNEGNKVSVSRSEDEEVVEHNPVTSEGIYATTKEVPQEGHEKELDLTTVDTSMEDVNIETATETATERGDTDMKYGEEGAGVYRTEARRDSRFKNLFAGESNQDERMAEPSEPDTEQDRSIQPATHPATPALYIRDIMRPLNAAQLKSHIASLAAAPGQEPDPEVIVDFYIDSIRTHAFISFTSVTAASRVRSALHDRIWPDEKTRKPLWIDFVPVDKVREWVEIEQASNPGRAIGKKWEVVYDMDVDRNVTVALQDVLSMPRQTPFQKQSFSAPTPQQQPVQPRIQTQGSGVLSVPNNPDSQSRLDQLFKSTTTKPKLYFKPVSQEVADRRLDALDAATSKKMTPGQSLDGPVNRYTFEDDSLVDRGPEIFPGIRPPPGFRGPSFGGEFSGGASRGRADRGIDRGGDRGGFNDRGGYHDRGGYRGRGAHGGGRSGYGPPDRDPYPVSDRRGYRGDRGARGERGGYGRDSYRGGGGESDRRYDSYRGDRRDSRDYGRR
jgi:hypothetical protein